MRRFEITRGADAASRRRAFELLAAMVLLMWGLETVDQLGSEQLDRHGIEPRDSDGLAGIAAAPFLHVGFGHLMSNTVPFIAMGATIAFNGIKRVAAVTAIVALVSGVGTWAIAPEGTVHLGASGVVFGYATYLMARGFFDRDLVEIAIGLVVVAIWGTALLAGLAPQAGVSWQGHFFGAVGGVIAARALKRDRDRPARTAGAGPSAVS